MFFFPGGMSNPANTFFFWSIAGRDSEYPSFSARKVLQNPLVNSLSESLVELRKCVREKYSDDDFNFSSPSRPSLLTIFNKMKTPEGCSDHLLSVCNDHSKLRVMLGTERMKDLSIYEYYDKFKTEEYNAGLTVTLGMSKTSNLTFGYAFFLVRDLYKTKDDVSKFVFKF